MATNQPPRPRFNPKVEKNPKYSKWAPATRKDKFLNFMVPQDYIPTQFDWKNVLPYDNPGQYGPENYKIGANYVPMIMSVWPEMNFNDAVGLSSTFLTESGGNPTAREGRIVAASQPVTAKFMEGPGGFGLAQLTGPRKIAFWKYVNKDPRRAADPMEQLRYMRLESEGKIKGLESEKDMYAKARGSKNPAQGGYNAVKFIERPRFTDTWPVRMANSDSVADYTMNMPRRQAPTQYPIVQQLPFLERVQRAIPETWDAIMSIFD